MPRKLTTSIVKQRINKLGHGQYIPINFHYHGEKAQFYMYHKKCGNVYKTYWSTFQAGTRCPYCRGVFRFSKKTAKQLINSAHHHHYKLMLKGKYINEHQKLPIYHKICGNTFPMTLNHFRKGELCPYCQHRSVVTIPYIRKKIQRQGHHKYVLLEKDKRSVRSKSCIHVLHLSCNRVFTTSWDRWNSGCRCPYCQASHGEVCTGLYLQHHHIKYIYGYHTACYTSKYSKENGEPLHLDFYLPKYQVGIEYDGVQHVHPVNHFGGIKKFKLTKKRDHLKDKWCKDNNIKLIRIRYPYKNQHSKFTPKIKKNIIKTLDNQLLPLLK